MGNVNNTASTSPQDIPPLVFVSSQSTCYECHKSNSQRPTDSNDSDGSDTPEQVTPSETCSHLISPADAIPAISIKSPTPHEDDIKSCPPEALVVSNTMRHIMLTQPTCESGPFVKTTDDEVGIEQSILNNLNFDDTASNVINVLEKSLAEQVIFSQGVTSALQIKDFSPLHYVRTTCTTREDFNAPIISRTIGDTCVTRTIRNARSLPSKAAGIPTSGFGMVDNKNDTIEDYPFAAGAVPSNEPITKALPLPPSPGCPEQPKHFEHETAMCNPKLKFSSGPRVQSPPIESERDNSPKLTGFVRNIPPHLREGGHRCNFRAVGRHSIQCCDDDLEFGQFKLRRIHDSPPGRQCGYERNNLPPYDHDTLRQSPRRNVQPESHRPIPDDHELYYPETRAPALNYWRSGLTNSQRFIPGDVRYLPPDAPCTCEFSSARNVPNNCRLDDMDYRPSIRRFPNDNNLREEFNTPGPPGSERVVWGTDEHFVIASDERRPPSMHPILRQYRETQYESRDHQDRTSRSGIASGTQEDLTEHYRSAPRRPNQPSFVPRSPPYLRYHTKVPPLQRKAECHPQPGRGVNRTRRPSGGLPARPEGTDRRDAFCHEDALPRSAFTPLGRYPTEGGDSPPLPTSHRPFRPDFHAPVDDSRRWCEAAPTRPPDGDSRERTMETFPLARRSPPGWPRLFRSHQSPVVDNVHRATPIQDLQQSKYMWPSNNSRVVSEDIAHEVIESTLSPVNRRSCIVDLD